MSGTTKFHQVLLVAAVFCFSGSGESFAQRSVNLRVALTNGASVEINWLSQSVVPAPGRQLFPDYRLERSTDLTTWTQVGQQIAGPTNGPARTLRVADTASGNALAFYRIESTIDRPLGNFIGAQLNGGDLRFANFFGAQLFAAQLQAAKLQQADLRGVDLRSANLSSAELTGANLFGAKAFAAVAEAADLTRANLSFADFGSADLFNADLTATDLRSTILANADLRFVALHRSRLDANTLLDAKWRQVWRLVNEGAPGEVITNADLSSADLRGANLNGADLRRTDLTFAFFSSADLRGANLEGANVRFVAWNGTQLDTNTTLEAKARLIWQIVNEGAQGRDLARTNLSNAFLSEVDFRGANLTNANFTQSILFEANLGGADLSRANLIGTELSSAILTNANLTFAILRSANLTEANLRGAITNGADFAGATFSKTIMPDGTVR